MRSLVLFFQIQGPNLVGIVCAGKNGAKGMVKDFCQSLDDKPGGLENVSWGACLRDALGAKDAARIKSCYLVLHRSDYAVMRVDLPPGTPSETVSMLELELADRLPTDLSRICFGWERVGTAGDGRQIVQVYWTPQERLGLIHEALKRAGLDLTGVLPSFAVYRRLFMGEAPERPTVMLHATTAAFEYVGWDRDGSISFSRGKMATDLALQTHFDGAILHEEIGEKIRSMEVWLPEGITPCILQLGDRGHDALKHDAPEDDWAVCEGDRPLSLGRMEDALRKLKTMDVGRFLVLLASAELMAVRPAQVSQEDLAGHLNMLPRQILKDNAHSQLMRLAVQAGVLLAAIIILIAGNIWLYIHQMEAQLERNQAEIKRLGPDVKEIETMEERISTIKEQLDYAISPVDALREINAVLANAPDVLEGLYLDHMTYQATGDIVMEGHAVNDITPWKFADELDNGGIFEILQKPKIEWHMYGGTRSIRFSLKVRAGRVAAPAPGDEKK